MERAFEDGTEWNRAVKEGVKDVEMGTADLEDQSSLGIEAGLSGGLHSSL